MDNSTKIKIKELLSNDEFVDKLLDKLLNKNQDNKENSNSSQNSNGQETNRDDNQEGSQSGDTDNDQKNDNQKDSSSNDSGENNNSPKDKSDMSSDSDSNSDSNDSADSSSNTQSGSDSGNGSKSKKPKKDPNAKPTIGDKGDEDIQKAEDEERKKTIEKEKAEDAEKGISSDDEKDDTEERLKRIKDILNDKSTAEKITGEAEDIVNKEKLAKAARDLNRYNSSPLKKFKESLQGFIKKEIGEEKNKSWSKINKKYAGTGTIKAGVSKHASGKIPLINVYFDRSGSWDSSKTKVGEQAIATLNNYVRQHKLKIDLYYFNTEIHSEDPGGRGGTRGTPILEHIKNTKPDNVIVMTDDDIRDCAETVTVPGGVWLLFKGGVSENLKEHLKGKKLTKSFNLESYS